MASKNQGKIFVGFNLLKPLAKKLKKLASEEKRSQSAFLETIIENFLKEKAQ